MILTPQRKRIAVGLWVLSALLVLWYNGVVLLSLWDREISALSPAARATIAKRQQLEHRMAQRLRSMMDPLKIDAIAARIDARRATKPAPKPTAGTAPKASRQRVEPAPEKEVKLPSLEAVIAVYRPVTGKEYLAVMNGSALEVQSRINDFVIKDIDMKGVLLTRGTKTYFIPAPQIAYSTDKSMEE